LTDAIETYLHTKNILEGLWKENVVIDILCPLGIFCAHQLYFVVVWCVLFSCTKKNLFYYNTTQLFLSSFFKNLYNTNKWNLAATESKDRKFFNANSSFHRFTDTLPSIFPETKRVIIHSLYFTGQAKTCTSVSAHFSWLPDAFPKIKPKM
jgi:hypothetical protein